MESGIHTDTEIPDLMAATAKSLITLLASPIHANFKPLVSPKVSFMLNKSAMACKGWYLSHNEFIIGTDESLHKSKISWCLFTSANMHEVIDDITLVVSYVDSLTPNWISSLPKNMGVAPKYEAAPSVSISVSVDLLENNNVTSLPKSFWYWWNGAGSPDSTCFLKAAASEIKAENSSLESCPILTKCFGF